MLLSKASIRPLQMRVFFVGLRNYKMAFEDELLLTRVEEQLEIIFMRSDIDSAFTCHCINFI